MSNVSTQTALPPGTPVTEIDADTARSVATGDMWSLSDLLPTIEADFTKAIALFDAGKEALVVVKIVAPQG